MFTIISSYYSTCSVKNVIIDYAEKHSGLGQAHKKTGPPQSTRNSRFRSISTSRIEVLGFLKDQIREYIKHYNFSTESKGVDLYRYLNQHPNVHHMCYLPIHVAMVCFLFDNNIEADIPTTETEIYRDFTKFSCFVSI